MELMITLGLLFITGAVVLLTSRRIGIPAIPGLVLTGLAISSFYEVGDLSEMVLLGISFLVFYIGLRTDLEGFRRVSADALSVSLIQVGLTFFLGFALATYLGLSDVEALYVALVASLASTLAGTGIFDESLRMDLHHGQISTASNFIQDVLAVVAIPLIASGMDSGIQALAVLAAAFIFRETFSRRFQRYVGSNELKTLVMVAVFALAAGSSQFLDISVITLSFAAGLMFSKGELVDEFLEVLEPVKDFFSVILFTALGALLTYPSNTVLTVSALIVFMAAVFRPLVSYFVMLLDGHGARKSFKTSTSMLQVSEFALAAVIVAFAAGTVEAYILEAVIIATAFTMVFSSFTVRHLDRIYETSGPMLERIEEAFEYSIRTHDMEDHVIVVGYGLAGRKAVEYLEETGKEFIVIDYNAENVERAEIEGLKYVFGDVLDDRVLEAACIDSASELICTSDHRPVVEKVEGLGLPRLQLVETEKQASKIKAGDIEVVVESDLIRKGMSQRLENFIEE